MALQIRFDLPLCIVPRETVLCFVLIGYKLEAVPGEATPSEPRGASLGSSLIRTQQLAWVGVSIFDIRRRV